MPKATKASKALLVLADLANRPDLSMNDIGRKYGLDNRTVAKINWGRMGKFGIAKFPVRTTEFFDYRAQMYAIQQQEILERRRKYQEEIQNRYNGVINDIRFTNMSLTQIAKKYKMKYSEMTRINTGERHKIEGLDYPLRKTSTLRNRAVLADYKTGKYTKEELCKKHGIPPEDFRDLLWYRKNRRSVK